MSQSKLKSVEKKMIDGVHATYQGDKGKFYKFIVEFENGDKGGSMSTKEQPTWTIGTEYTYDKEVKGEFTNIKNIKDPTKSYSNGNSNYVSYYDKPEVQLAINHTYAMNMSLEYCSNKENMDPPQLIPEGAQEQLRIAIFNWIYSFESPMSEMVNIRECLNGVFKNMKFLKLNTGNELLNKAKEHYLKLKELRADAGKTEQSPI